MSLMARVTARAEAQRQAAAVITTRSFWQRHAVPGAVAELPQGASGFCKRDGDSISTGASPRVSMGGGSFDCGGGWGGGGPAEYVWCSGALDVDEAAAATLDGAAGGAGGLSGFEFPSLRALSPDPECLLLHAPAPHYCAAAVARFEGVAGAGADEDPGFNARPPPSERLLPQQLLQLGDGAPQPGRSSSVATDGGCCCCASSSSSGRLSASEPQAEHRRFPHQPPCQQPCAATRAQAS